MASCTKQDDELATTDSKRFSKVYSQRDGCKDQTTEFIYKNGLLDYVITDGITQEKHLHYKNGKVYLIAYNNIVDSILYTDDGLLDEIRRTVVYDNREPEELLFKYYYNELGQVITVITYDSFSSDLINDITTHLWDNNNIIQTLWNERSGRTRYSFIEYDNSVNWMKFDPYSFNSPFVKNRNNILTQRDSFPINYQFSLPPAECFPCTYEYEYDETFTPIVRYYSSSNGRTSYTEFTYE